MKNSDNSGSFEYMLKQYGLSSSYETNQYGITKAPLYFVQGGSLNFTSNKWGRIGSGDIGYYWGGTATNNDSGFLFDFWADDVESNTDNDRYRGFSLRCLSTN